MIEHYLAPEKILAVAIDNGDDYKNDDTSGDEPDIWEGSFLKDLKEVDLKEAIANCGGAEVLEGVVKDYLSSIEDKANAIEYFLKEGDIRNYTVLVHALKSSSRLIGAMELSKMAAELEALGDAEQVDELIEKTPALLEKYRGYMEHLKPAKGEDKSDLPEISVDELEGAFRDIKELVEVYDFDTADSIMKMLDAYSIPAEASEKFQKLSKLMVEVNREEILKLI